MNLSVVILNWNNAADTVACARSLQSWTGTKPEVWVVDNASTDGGVEIILRDCPSVRLIRNPENRGFAGGNNAAIRKILNESKADAILLLNNDARLAEPDALALFQTLEKHPQIGIVGPAIDEAGRLSTGGRDIAWHIYSRRWSGDTSPKDRLIEADYVSGTVAVVRAEAFREAGLFDEDYFFSGEMADLCQRVKQNGFLCCVSIAARAKHETHHASALRDTLYAYYNLRNRFLYVRKFYPFLKFALIPGWTVTGLLMAGLALVMGKTDKARAVALALADGILNRYGNRNGKFIRQS